jgi:transposase
MAGAQRLLMLDTWRRSGLPAGDFAPLVGISKHTLYAWKHKFETEGRPPAHKQSPASCEEFDHGSH